MNEYLIPICNDSKVYIKKIVARSINSCKEKLMEEFSYIVESDDWDNFIAELRSEDILIGKILDKDEI